MSSLESLDLGSNALSGPLPPELGELASLKALILLGNNLTGAIPAQLGALASLERLYLSSNELSGPIPPELGDLANLEALILGGNNLTGAIPPQLDGLSSLSELRLDGNKLTGAIPKQVGDLADLESLDLSGNGLSGPLPRELGDLANLRLLDLRENVLTGAIPGQLGDLTNLSSLLLDENRLSGAIPPELGNLANLERLQLIGNELTGPVPFEFGALASLNMLELSGNTGLTGVLPASLTDLCVESLLAADTDLCAPSAPDFQAWLSTIPRQWIARCGAVNAYLIQAVQSRKHPVPLVAGKGALLRVFMTAAKSTHEGIPPVRARFYLNGTERHMVDIPAKSTPIPTRVEEGDLSKSANAEIPGRIVRPGLEMVIEVDPTGTLDPELRIPRRIPETGRLPLEVREMPVLDLTVIPLLWSANPDSAVLEAATGMADDPEGHVLLEETRNLLPVGGLDVTAHDPVVSSSNGAFVLLSEIEALRVLEGGKGHYMGMMSVSVTSAIGVAHLAGRSAVSIPASGTIAHELGHNMSLRHAPCGRVLGADRSFPDPSGLIGAWGYDSRSGRLVSPRRPDLMSYCISQWISDYHFTNALRHRLSDEGASAAVGVAPVAQSLLLWGGIDVEGSPFLNPAFVVEAPTALPDSVGDYTLTGHDAGGGELFSLSFAMPELASDAEAGSSFAFALPVRPAWADVLASVTLSGPDGAVTLDGDTDRPMAILRDPVTGQVRAFLRDLPQAAQAAMGAAEQAASPGMEVLFSRGIPDPLAWRP